ncbi:hypothetical protein JG688_00016919 [Phytophthora aleatoria]|uniref:Uncharacterized protein n=1 Tax=Phytophthora aleatoria TaxID=2496075 RepID=A0A8J5IET9_9STRA|nr:hypothetical protein JG688_00016919 [Phytophthora aleatoria]
MVVYNPSPVCYTILRSKSCVPAARTAPRAAPDNAQLAAAVEVIRRTYAADIEAAEARALASRDVGATATSPTPAIEAPATQAAVPQAPTRRAETDTAATQAALSTPVCSSSPRPLRSSPHVQDSDVVSVSDDVASDNTMIPDNDVVGSLYTPSDDEHGKLSDMLHIVLHLTVHRMMHISTYCDTCWSEHCAVY